MDCAREFLEKFFAKAYRESGEAGSRNQVRSSGSRRKLPGPVRKRIVKIKKQAFLWSPADIPSIRAGALPECLSGNGAADLAGTVLDCFLKEERTQKAR